ncbi:MAG TPA: hypothetical protein VJI69_03825 [Bacteroidia bacterium]|nr:hypothetical protein [Bacteroidia bacterium]
MHHLFQKTLKGIALLVFITLFSGCFATRKKNRCGDCPKWKMEIINLFAK